MAQYTYEAIALDGKAKKGNIEADNIDKARSQLKSEGLTIIKLSEASLLNKDINFSFGK